MYIVLNWSNVLFVAFDMTAVWSQTLFALHTQRQQMKSNYITYILRSENNKLHVT